MGYHALSILQTSTTHAGRGSDPSFAEHTLDRLYRPGFRNFEDHLGPVVVDSVRDGYVFYRRDGGEMLRMSAKAFSARFRRRA